MIDPKEEQIPTTNPNAEETLNKYARQSEYWIGLLEKENLFLLDVLDKLVGSFPLAGPNNKEKVELDLAILYLYFKSYNLFLALNQLNQNNHDSKSITARFIILRSAYETMCAIHYLVHFNDKAARFYDATKKLNIEELHKGFPSPKGHEMYRTVYRFLCDLAHPNILAARSHRVIRIYSIKGQLLTLDDTYEQVKLVFLELFFNYYCWMILRNIITVFLDENVVHIPIILRSIDTHGNEIFTDSLLEHLRIWQDQFPTMSKFIDEIQETIMTCRNVPIKVNDVEDLLSRVENIYELREHKQLIQHFKKLISEKYQ
ncbi:hypothetical protein HZC07_04465 [Candidatus Micrarchaeota archaeon]|nr:hypothetical protein [Candidatus Micrarchaeota archaeon]